MPQLKYWNLFEWITPVSTIQQLDMLMLLTSRVVIKDQTNLLGIKSGGGPFYFGLLGYSWQMNMFITLGCMSNNKY